MPVLLKLFSLVPGDNKTEYALLGWVFNELECTTCWDLD